MISSHMRFVGICSLAANIMSAAELTSSPSLTIIQRNGASCTYDITSIPGFFTAAQTLHKDIKDLLAYAPQEEINGFTFFLHNFYCKLDRLMKKARPATVTPCPSGNKLLKELIDDSQRKQLFEAFKEKRTWATKTAHNEFLTVTLVAKLKALKVPFTEESLAFFLSFWRFKKEEFTESLFIKNSQLKTKHERPLQHALATLYALAVDNTSPASA